MASSSSVSKDAAATMMMIQQQQNPSSEVVAAAAAVGEGKVEDDSWKKNTDCVYFLASPLTCKKGIECEFRHSEAARFNPKDCWYWMNGACLNPKCPFRHPPLDGLSGSPGAASGTPSTPFAQAIPPAQNGSAKQGVPCIFFQKGYCLKGDRCPFVHGSYPAGNKVPQAPPAAPTTGPPAPGKAFGGLEKCSQQKSVPQVNASRPIQAVPEVKPTANTTMAVPRNDAYSVNHGLPPSTRLVNAVNPSKERSATPSNETSGSKHNRIIRASSMEDTSFQNDKDADELLRESSPGFDVLVDDEEGEYYHNEDQFMRIGGLDGRNLNDLDIGHADDYNPVVDVDRERYRDPRDYDSYGRMRDRYAPEHRRRSSERSLREPVHSDQRGTEKADLRSRLSKQRRVNGPRSMVNPDHASHRHAEEHSRRSSQRGSYRSPPHERPLSSRLQGRIKLPRSPPNDDVLTSERRSDRERDHRRISPNGLQNTSHQGSVRERLGGRIRDETSEGRLRGTRAKDGVLDSNGSNFAGPKSLAELKVIKQPYGKDQGVNQDQMGAVGKRKFSTLESTRPGDDDLSFEGPMPLSEILKRKREARASASAVPSIAPAENGDQRSAAISEELSKSQDALSSAGEQETRLPTDADKQEDKSNGHEEVLPDFDTKTKRSKASSSLVNEENVPQQEEGLIAEEEADQQHEVEDYEQADGEYEYEEGDGEGYVEDGEGYVEDGENAPDLEDDYMDEDDGDDFAKKIGVMLF